MSQDVIAKKYLSSGLKTEYDKMVINTFANDPHVQIIHNLRNFMLHVDIPTISNQINIFTGNSSYLSLPPERLLNWNKWKRIEKEYLIDLIRKKETIVIHKFFQVYTDKAEFIFDFLLKAITDSNNKELSEIYDLNDQILDAIKADKYITDPLFVHFFSRNEQYNEEGNMIPIFKCSDSQF